MKPSDERKALRMKGLRSATRNPRSLQPQRCTGCGAKVLGGRCLECDIERQKKNAKL